MSGKRFWRRALCFVMVWSLLVQPLTPPLMAAIDDTNGQNAGEAKFSPAEAVSPGEYLAKIKELRGADRSEIEKHSFAQWALIMTNVLILTDSKAIDVPTYQNALGAVLKTKSEIQGIITGSDSRIKWPARITTWGITHFAKGDGALAKVCTNLLNAWKWIGNRPGVSQFTEFANYMSAPSGKEAAGAFQQWLQRKPPAEGAKTLSNLAGTARVVGTVLQILAGCAEIGSFFSAKADDPGAVSFATVQRAVNGTLLIVTAVMALIPPPGVWAALAAGIMTIWKTLKDVLQYVGDKIQKWHKVYEDSQTFMQEQDDDYAAFVSENRASTALEKHEKSSALVFADEMLAALNKEPGEGEIAERHKELVQNMRLQGLLTTYYYQQATAARELPVDSEELYRIWSNRADYMSWKPQKPEKWYDIISDWADWQVSTQVELQRLESGDTFASELEKDLHELQYRAFFCPDFALLVYFRNFIMMRRGVLGEADLPPLYSLIGTRIEQAPFNYLPLVELYSTSYRGWTNGVFREAFAADSYNVGTKELPLLVGQVKMQKEELQNSYGAVLAKMLGLYCDKYETGNHDYLRPKIDEHLRSLARVRVCIDGLIDAFLDDKEENIKDLEVSFEFNGESGDCKIIDELFAGVFQEPYDSFSSGMAPAKVEKTDEDDQTPAYMFAEYGKKLAVFLQCTVNSMGISGVDVVQLGIQTKNTSDILALADYTQKDRKAAFDAMGEIFTSEAFRRLLWKGEYLDVTRSGASNFLSGFDPPYDVLQLEVEKFGKAVKEGREELEKQQKDVEILQQLIKGEYEEWLALLRKWEENADELGISLDISSEDENYRAELLDLITNFDPLNPEVEIQ